MFVNFLDTAPFVRLTTFLIVGIAVQLFAPLPLHIVWGTACICLVMMLLYELWPVRLRYLYGWVTGMMICILLICVGCLLLRYTDIRYNRYYYRNIVQSGDWLIGTVDEPLQEKARSYQTIIRLTGVLRNDSLLPVKGFVLLYLEKDSLASVVQCGDRLIMKNKLEVLTGSRNPGGFDYARYFSAREIYEQCYLQADRWLVCGHESSVWLQARNYCLRVLRKYIGGREAGLGAALLIGYRYDMDKETEHDYTNTGIIHIVAISGMHLMLIYENLLLFLPRSRLMQVPVIVILWLFTLLTGACASILRACVMLTLLITGKLLVDYPATTYNLLAASAFLLLCYEPRLLMDVGFQLSYLAVLSLTICFKPIYQLIGGLKGVADRIWKIIASSIAAQVFTLPFCIYYFHQFPLYFLPANMLAIPLSTVVLYGEILLLAVPLPVIGDCLKWMMAFMNESVSWIGSLPGAVIKDLYIPVYVVFCMYGMLGGLSIYIANKKGTGVIILLLAVLIWEVVDLRECRVAMKQRILVVYNIKGRTSVDVITGKTATNLGDTVLAFTRTHYHINRSLKTDWKAIRFGNKVLQVIDSSFVPVAVSKKIRINYLLLSHNPRVDIKQLDAMFKTDVIIFDDSNTRKNIQQWKNGCDTLTLRFFSVPHQGAYVVNF